MTATLCQKRPHAPSIHSQRVRRFGFFCSLLISLLGFSNCTTVHKDFAQLKPREAKRFAPYAMMAANSYHHERERFEVESLGWVQVDRAGNRTCEPTYSSGFSLAYDIFRNDARKEYAFVYRGTDSILDFLWANLAVFISPQYELADWHFKQFLKKVPSNYTVVTVGHSLGAGLALRESVLHGKDAIVFNPSPRLFGPPVRSYQKATRIVVFQKDEILSAIRRRTSTWYLATENGAVYESNFDFGRDLQRKPGLKRWIGLHSMSKLAAAIAADGAGKDPRLHDVALR